MVLFDPGLNGMPGLSNVNSSTLTGNAVYYRCRQANVILDRARKTGNPYRWEAYTSDKYLDSV
jgi:hypothetical protein